MRKVFLLSTVLLLLFKGAAAQDIRIGVLCPYPDSPGVETPVPSGYKPFYISHFGRHGSRHHSNEKIIAPALAGFKAAGEEGILTPAGEYMLQKVLEMNAYSSGMWGQLSDLGIEEHKAIARRMVKRCPGVFTDSVRVLSSIFPRCILSMAASTGEIQRYCPKTKWSYRLGKRYQSVINTSHRPDGWRSGSSQQKKYLQEHLDYEQLLSALFTDPNRAKELTGGSTAFSKSVFAVWCGRRAIGLEPFDLDAIIGTDAVDVIAASENLAHYRNMAVPNADSLITDIVEKADAAIASGKPSADLRYGHDNGLMRLLVQMGMEGYPLDLDNDSAAAYNFADKVPLAANLQMIFYRNRKGIVLVKFLVNEKECAINTLRGGPYYPWKDVRDLLYKHCIK